MVLVDTPFHSLSKITPVTLLKVTFRAISILHEKANIMAFSARKLLLTDKPKNCEYHSNPAKEQNNRLLIHILRLFEV